MEADYDPTDRLEAMKRAMEFDERIPIGVIYKEEKEDFHKKNIVLAGKEPLLDQKTDMKVIQSLIQEFV